MLNILFQYDPKQSRQSIQWKTAESSRPRPRRQEPNQEGAHVKIKNQGHADCFL